ncbi:MAG: HAD-IA family hydrolase [Pseudomonadota bacterium]
MPTAWPMRDFDALLFDMDGTILSSIKAAERVWAAWAQAHGIDVAAFLPTIHGVRSVETVARLGLPGVDPVVEAARITQAEIEDVAGIEPIVGAAEFLAALPAERWAIATSAPRALATRRIEAAGLPMPAVLVAAEDVARGKPAPDCFLLAAERLGHRAQACLVFEDTLAGVRAAEAAGMATVAITATHRHPMEISALSVPDYRHLRASRTPDGALRIMRGT